ncbi:hypothetical protein Pnap_0596 [Polaromonas naphthalenivorans CJ2]|uniref:Uncharacterized protein n=1 Tax=Polaromonas naphthalenivorans (strain CJ2) TaxID=365044 RepID=A1VJT7_POLNA|nr:hypothetical protein Pnap_0596 [Polaromonas naphthalenivorans CJ2]
MISDDSFLCPLNSKSMCRRISPPTIPSNGVVRPSPASVARKFLRPCFLQFSEEKSGFFLRAQGVSGSNRGSKKEAFCYVTNETEVLIDAMRSFPKAEVAQ